MTIDDALFKQAWPRVYAAAVRVAGGDFAAGEDATAEAFTRATSAWARDRPDNPVGWLITTARRIVIDEHRKQATRDRSAQRLIANTEHDNTRPSSTTGDDVLDLFFTCAHPSLTPEAQVALTLRAVAGMRPAEIARAFHCSPSTMEKRLVRARRKILEAGISLRSPDRAELDERLGPVMRSILLVFNEGYAPTAGGEAFRQELCDEAILLARSLHDMLPDQPEPPALLATLLFIDARKSARIDQSGDLVALRFQDRQRWNSTNIAEGVELTLDALNSPNRGDYTLQAAIGALHVEAPSYELTDWARIALLYEQRLQQSKTPSPTLILAHAIAVAESHGTASARPLLHRVKPAEDLTVFLYHTALARFAEIDNDIDAALLNIAAAREVAPTTADAAALDKWSIKLDKSRAKATDSVTPSTRSKQSSA